MLYMYNYFNNSCVCVGGGGGGAVFTYLYLWYIQTTLLGAVISVDWLELGVEAIQHI